MPSKSPTATRPSSHASRLLLPAHIPPLPIPPRLLLRLHEPRNTPPPPNVKQNWIDGDEFALALSSSQGGARGAAVSRNGDHQRTSSACVPPGTPHYTTPLLSMHDTHSTNTHFVLSSTAQITSSSRRLPPKSSRSMPISNTLSGPRFQPPSPIRSNERGGVPSSQ